MYRVSTVGFRNHGQLSRRDSGETCQSRMAEVSSCRIVESISYLGDGRIVGERKPLTKLDRSPFTPQRYKQYLHESPRATNSHRR